MTRRVIGRLSKSSKDLVTNSRLPEYLSTCIYCGWGVFTNHLYDWQGCDGYVHTYCDDPKGEKLNGSG